MTASDGTAPAATVTAPVLAPKGPLLFVFSGPSGVGKDSVVERLRGPGRHFVVTVTTRAPRPGEQDGVHYHFRTREQFQHLLSHNELLEWAKVYDNFYGTPLFELRKAMQAGDDVVTRVDVQGAAAIKQKVPEAILIFIAPESFTDLESRLRDRATESTQDRNLRLETAPQELAAMAEFDYVLVNRAGSLDETVKSAEAVMLAEKLRAHPNVFRLP